MDARKCIQHFDNEMGLGLMLDWHFRDDGVEGGFPIPNAVDGGKQALLYDAYGIWLLHETAGRNGNNEDVMRFFSWDAVTACMLYQAETVRDAYSDHETTFDERTSQVLASTRLDITIAGSSFSFSGDQIAAMIREEDERPKVLGDMFGIARRCVAAGVPVEMAAGVPQPVLAV